MDPIILPQTNQWYSGYGRPTSVVIRDSREGDYYFDQENFIIYYFDGYEYVEVINLTENNRPTSTVTVNFNPNGGTFISQTVGRIEITKGETIPAERIPLCSKEGYSFEGYYTTAEGPSNPLSGKLTDLTPIFLM